MDKVSIIFYMLLEMTEVKAASVYVHGEDGLPFVGKLFSGKFPIVFLSIRYLIFVTTYVQTTVVDHCCNLYRKTSSLLKPAVNRYRSFMSI